MFYANNRDGTFSDISGVVGLDFIEDGRAFALADFNHDGRQEVLLKNRNAPQLRLLQNVMERLPASIVFCLRGHQSNRDAIGAAVTVETSAGRQTRRLQAGSGFLSQHSKELLFGLGEAEGAVSASILWPSGLVQHLSGLPANHRIRVEEGVEAIRTEPFQATLPSHSPAPPQPSDTLPATVETWLLAPVPAPDFRGLTALRGTTVLLHLPAPQSPGYRLKGLPLLTLNVEEAEDTAGIYNLLYRYLFDRHRDLRLPVSFLIDGKGNIVKVYQGQVSPERIEQDSRHIPESVAGRLDKALPFPGVAGHYEFGRNHLSLGSVFFQHGYIEQAGASFRLALRDDPSSAEAHYGSGSVYMSRKRRARRATALNKRCVSRQAIPILCPMRGTISACSTHAKDTPAKPSCASRKRVYKKLCKRPSRGPH